MFGGQSEFVKAAEKLIIKIVIGLVLINFLSGGILTTAWHEVMKSGDQNESYNYSVQNSRESASSVGRLTITPSNFSSQPTTVQFGVMLAVVGMLLAVVANVFIAIQMFLVSVPYGLVCFFFLPASYFFALLYYEKCMLPLVGLITGTLLALMGWATVVFLA